MNNSVSLSHSYVTTFLSPSYHMLFFSSSTLSNSFCFPLGRGCQDLDCPGDPNCNGRGQCVVDDNGRSVCVDCQEGWIGRACEIRCMNGSQHAENQEMCVCDECYAGVHCDQLCSGRENASCVNGKCICGFEGWRGDLCDVPGKTIELKL